MNLNLKFESVWDSKTIVFSRENAKIWQIIVEIFRENVEKRFSWACLKLKDEIFRENGDSASVLDTLKLRFFREIVKNLPDLDLEMSLKMIIFT